VATAIVLPACRESRHGTQECVRHGSPGLRRFRDAGLELVARAEVAIQEIADGSQTRPRAGGTVLGFEMVAAGASALAQGGGHNVLPLSIHWMLACQVRLRDPL